MEEGKVIAGKYRLERALARGGMGSVWVGRHLQLEIDVAIKFLAPEFAESGEARRRFEREAKASAQLKHANVVQVHDYGVEGDSPYLVMELLEGEDLDARLEREGRLPLAAAAAILGPVCKALRRAHEVELVHRDLKPANIFLARQGDEETPKILDFGIAKATGPGVVGKATQTGALMGSPHYMSPEQVRSSAKVDKRSDLWSMGIIAFRVLTGKLPFEGDEIGDVLVEICTGPIPAPSTLVPELGPEVDRFFERALKREPGARFQSARELAEAFATLAGEKAPAFSAPSGNVPPATATPTPAVAEMGLAATVAVAAPAVSSTVLIPVAPATTTLRSEPEAVAVVAAEPIAVAAPVVRDAPAALAAPAPAPSRARLFVAIGAVVVALGVVGFRARRGKPAPVPESVVAPAVAAATAHPKPVVPVVPVAPVAPHHVPAAPVPTAAPVPSPSTPAETPPPKASSVPTGQPTPGGTSAPTGPKTPVKKP